MAVVDVPWELSQSIFRGKAEVGVLLQRLIIVAGLCPSDTCYNHCEAVSMEVVSPSLIVLSDRIGGIDTDVLVDLVLRTFTQMAVGYHVLLSFN